MRSRRTFGRFVAGAVASLASLAWLSLVISGGGSSQPPPPPAPTIAASPASLDVLVGQKQTVALTVAISLGQITGVTVSPNLVALAMNMAQVFTSNVTGSGTFPSTVTWTVPPGMGSIGSDGTYTPPQGVQGFEQVTVRATVADGQTSATATVNVGFAWVEYYAPQGMNDAATAEALSLDQKSLMVADYRTTPGTSDTGTSPNDTIVGTAGLLLFSEQTGELEDSSWIGPTPSKITDMTTAPDGTVYAAGFTGNGSAREAWVLEITVATPLQVTQLPQFQIGSVRTEAHAVQFYQGNIWLGVNSADQETAAECPGPEGDRCSTGGDYAVVMDPSGSREPEWPLNTFGLYATSMTGMLVTPQMLYATGNILDVNNNLQTTYFGHYSPVDPATGMSQYPVIQWTYPPTFYGSRVFQTGSGELLLAGTLSFTFSVQEGFVITGSDAEFNENLDGQWNGGNGGSPSVSRALTSALNPDQEGLTSGGSCSQMGGTDASVTDACAISRPGTQPSGQLLPILWAQRFDSAHMPGGAYTALTSIKYDSQGNLLTAGRGTDGGSGCGAAPCQTVTVGNFPPPAPGS
jgi:hypothetical protein